MGHLNFDLRNDKGRVIVFLLDIHNIGDLLGDCLKDGLRLFDFNGNLYHGRHFNRNYLNIVLWNLHFYGSFDHFLLGW